MMKQTCFIIGFGLADVPGSTFFSGNQNLVLLQNLGKPHFGKASLEETPSDSIPDNPRELITTSPWGATHASFEGRNAELSGRF